MPVVAYQPKGAASLAASYVNLANPGTYDAAPGVAPTWDAVTGWVFTGTEWLNTSLVPGANNWTYIVQIASMLTSQYIFGANQTSPTRLVGLWPKSSVPSFICGTGAYANSFAGSTVSDGNIAMTGNTVYVNGTPTFTLTTATGLPSVPIYFGCSNANGTPATFGKGNIIAFAAYGSTLTPTQIAAIATAMGAL